MTGGCPQSSAPDWENVIRGSGPPGMRQTCQKRSCQLPASMLPTVSFKDQSPACSSSEEGEHFCCTVETHFSPNDSKLLSVLTQGHFTTPKSDGYAFHSQFCSVIEFYSKKQCTDFMRRYEMSWCSFKNICVCVHVYV